MKLICATLNDSNQCCEKLKSRLVNQGCKTELLNKHKKAIEKMQRKSDNTISKKRKAKSFL